MDSVVYCGNHFINYTNIWTSNKYNLYSLALAIEKNPGQSDKKAPYYVRLYQKAETRLCPPKLLHNFFGSSRGIQNWNMNLYGIFTWNWWTLSQEMGESKVDPQKAQSFLYFILKFESIISSCFALPFV